MFGLGFLAAGSELPVSGVRRCFAIRLRTQVRMFAMAWRLSLLRFFAACLMRTDANVPGAGTEQQFRISWAWVGTRPLGCMILVSLC